MAASTWTWKGGAGSSGDRARWTLAAGAGSAGGAPIPGDTVTTSAGQLSDGLGVLSELANLNILNTGTVKITDRGLLCGGQAGTSGSIAVSGTGAVLSVDNATTGISVGFAGAGTLNIGNRASLYTPVLALGGALTDPGGGGGFVSLTGTSRVQVSNILLLWAGSTLSVDSSSALTVGPVATYVPGAVLIESQSILAGGGVLSGAVVNNGLIEVANSLTQPFSNGAMLEITGTLSGTGEIDIVAGAGLQLDVSPGATQSIVFLSGGGKKLALPSPATVIPAPISGFGTGDRIEFGGVSRINGFSLSGSTLTLSCTDLSGSTVIRVFSNFSFAPGTPATYSTGFDYAMGLPYIMPTAYVSWSGAGGTAAFGARGNWTGAILPGAFDYATFNSASDTTISGLGSADTLNFLGSGTWRIAAGAILSAFTNLLIAASAGTSGALTASAGATLNAGNSVVLGARGALTNSGATIATTVLNNAGTIAGNGVLMAATRWSNDGSILVSGGVLTLSTPWLTESAGGHGVIQIGARSTLILNTGSVDAQQSVTFADNTGTLVIGQKLAANGAIPPGAASALGGFRATITGYQSGDAIQFSGVSVASVRQAGSTLTLYDQTTTPLGVLAFDTGTAANTAVARMALPDRSNLFWQADDGTTVVWRMNGISVAGGGVFGGLDPAWKLKASGDFNGDGHFDSVWQRDDGTIGVWELNGLTTIAGGDMGNAGISWHVIGTGDFNGDGRSDIVWQNNDGSILMWEMNGIGLVGGGIVGNPGAAWRVRNFGDFNGDGFSDILLQADDGAVSIWYMNGPSIAGGGVVGNAGVSWRVKGLGDFNGDGMADILWQNDDGTIAVWLMNGVTVIGGGVVGNPGTAWHVKGAVDVNGDGKSDVVLQNDDGGAAVWQLNGASLTGGGGVANPGVNWHIVGGDNMTFINGATGNGTLTASAVRDETFVFTTYASGAHAISGFDPLHDVVELAKASFANYAAVQTRSTASGGGTLITLDSKSSLLIQGVAPGALNANDFRFV